MRMLFGLLLAFFVGCTTSYELDEKWAPLEAIVEAPGNSGWVTTIAPNVYVGDLEGFLKRRPVDSWQFNAIMGHERIHAIRQLNYGRAAWLARYLVDQDFRWHEEQLGWYFQIRNSRNVNANAIIDSLNKYNPRLAPLEDIARWVYDVIANVWRPEPGELEGER